MMNSIVSGLINGVIMSAAITAIVWLVMRFTSTRVWNAATRYAVWWATLLVTLAIPALSVSILRLPWMHPVPPPASAAPEMQIRAGQHQMDSSIEPAASMRGLPFVERPASRSLFPIQLLSGRWVAWVAFVWVAVSLLMLARLI